MLVVEAEGVAAVVAGARAAGEMAIDLEFAADGRLRPELALVQVAWVAGETVEVRAIDPTVVDVAPVIALFGEIDVIVHAARQDLQLLATRFGLRASRLFDTQIAAAFAGLGDQLGYAKLVETLVGGGVKIDKDVQFTDWLKRPLTPRQLEYALEDVRHLPAMAAQLEERLDGLGRTAWVAAECDVLSGVAYAAAIAGAEDAWQDVGAGKKLRGADRAALMRLAAWRWRVAAERNKPPSWILADKALIEVAQKRPRDEDELKRIRGAGEVAREHGATVLAELALARVDAEAAGPDTSPRGGGPSAPRALLWEEVFMTLVQWAAERSKLPSRWIASRGDCEEMARWLDRGDARAEGHPLMTTWRREVVGETLRSWVRGELALVGDPGSAAGARLVPVAR